MSMEAWINTPAGRLVRVAKSTPPEWGGFLWQTVSFATLRTGDVVRASTVDKPSGFAPFLVTAASWETGLVYGRRCTPDGTPWSSHPEPVQLMHVTELWRIEPETGEANNAE